MHATVGVTARSERRLRHRAPPARTRLPAAASGASCARRGRTRALRALSTAYYAGWGASARWAPASSCLPTASQVGLAMSRMQTACLTASTARSALRAPAAPRGQQHAAQARMAIPHAVTSARAVRVARTSGLAMRPGASHARLAATARKVAARRCRVRLGALVARPACMSVVSASCAPKASAVRRKAQSRPPATPALTTISWDSKRAPSVWLAPSRTQRGRRRA